LMKHIKKETQKKELFSLFKTLPKVLINKTEQIQEKSKIDENLDFERGAMMRAVDKMRREKKARKDEKIKKSRRNEKREKEVKIPSLAEIFKVKDDNDYSLLEDEILQGLLVRKDHKLE